jgi:beta-glucosidase/6-phospho-beta-glucosidase/beta-galactosidase
MVHNMVYFAPKRPNVQADVDSAGHADYVYNRLWLNATINGDLDSNANGTIDSGEHHPEFVGKSDFIGINYYFRGKTLSIGGPIARDSARDFLPTTAYGAIVPRSAPDLAGGYPDGLQRADDGGRGLPVYITENGSPMRATSSAKPTS